MFFNSDEGLFFFYFSSYFKYIFLHSNSMKIWRRLTTESFLLWFIWTPSCVISLWNQVAESSLRSMSELNYWSKLQLRVYLSHFIFWWFRWCYCEWWSPSFTFKWQSSLHEWFYRRVGQQGKHSSSDVLLTI